MVRHACQEAVFMCQLMEEIFGENPSRVVYNNNQGVLFLVENSQVSQQTKCIVIWWHFVRDLQKHKKVISKFVWSKNNLADRATKNQAEKLFTQHARMLKEGTNLIAWREDVGDIGEPDPHEWCHLQIQANRLCDIDIGNYLVGNESPTNV